MNNKNRASMTLFVLFVSFSVAYGKNPVYHPALIYRLLVLHLAVDDANTISERLRLPDAKVETCAQIREWGALAPPSPSFSGFRTTNLAFAFGPRHINLTRICRSPLDGEVEDWRDQDGQTGVPRASVTKHSAYLMARGWLERLGVDIAALEWREPPSVFHHELPLPHRMVSSRFSVRWGPVDRITLQARGGQIDLNVTRKWLVGLYVRDVSEFGRYVPHVAHEVALSELEDEPVRAILHMRPGEDMRSLLDRTGFVFTNAFKLLEVPSSYESALRAKLLTETRRILGVLELDPANQPCEVTFTDVFVTPPAFGAGGRVTFERGEIQFDRVGKLRYFSCLPPGHSNYWEWAESAKSNISRQDAFRVAAQKLSTLGINVPRLDREHRRIVGQLRVHRRGTLATSRAYEAPAYYLTWVEKAGGQSNIVASAYVWGDVGKVAEIKLNETSYYDGATVSLTN